MIQLLKVTYLEKSDAIDAKINRYFDSIPDFEEMPAHTTVGEILSLAADMKEYSWEPADRSCIYIITQKRLWERFETEFLHRVGVQYTAEDVLDAYYRGDLRLRKMRLKIEKYLRFWMTSDDVLDKIRAHGMSSLTPADYKILRAAGEQS